MDDYIRRFREALEDGRVRADGASDFNTMMWLMATAKTRSSMTSRQRPDDA